jgi:Skp family chaperone for outer membrane proteins
MFVLFLKRNVRILVFLMILCACPLISIASEPTNIGTIDQDALFRESQFGQRVLQEVNEESELLLAKELLLQSELETEEQSLTVKRKIIGTEEFKKLAAEFDEKVQKIRSETTEARINLKKYSDEERNRFFQIVFPILLELSEEFGLSTLLDHRMVILSLKDMTGVAVDRVNKAIGNGKEIISD